MQINIYIEAYFSAFFLQISENCCTFANYLDKNVQTIRL